MAKYKIDAIQTQADLDEIIKAIRDESSSNYTDASARTQRKIENLEQQLKAAHQEMNEMEEEFQETLREVEETISEYDQALSEAYEANDTYELSDRLNDANIDPRFHDLMIRNGLNGDMKEEEFNEAINQFLERFPEAGLADDSPLKDEVVDPAAAEADDEDQEIFDTTRTMQ